MNVPESVPASWEGWSNCPSSSRPKFNPAGVYDFGKPLVSMRIDNLEARGMALTDVPVDRATPPPLTNLCPSSFYQCPPDSMGGYDGKGGIHAEWGPSTRG